jgi:hypothetical protein
MVMGNRGSDAQQVVRMSGGPHCCRLDLDRRRLGRRLGWSGGRRRGAEQQGGEARENADSSQLPRCHPTFHRSEQRI